MSDHLPVIAELSIPTTKAPTKQVTLTLKPKWERCNKNAYLMCIRSSLKRFPEETETEFDFMCSIGHLSSVLKRAAERSIPNFKTECKIRQTKIKVWNEKIHQAVKRSRHIWWEWKKADCPSEKNHPLNVYRKNIKKLIKSEQLRAAAKRNVVKIEEIMNSKSDSKMFAKLVNRQRKNNNCHVQSIVVNDIIIYDTPEEMCDG